MNFNETHFLSLPLLMYVNKNRTIFKNSSSFFFLHRALRRFMPFPSFFDINFKMFLK